jgi:hypothetical protein
VSKQKEKVFATVTFALYDETPIACQGDDDQKKIRVLTDSIPIGYDVHGDALRRSVVLGEARGSYVQVWDVQIKD